MTWEEKAKGDFIFGIVLTLLGLIGSLCTTRLLWVPVCFGVLTLIAMVK